MEGSPARGGVHNGVRGLTADYVQASTTTRFITCSSLTPHYMGLCTMVIAQQW